MENKPILETSKSFDSINTETFKDSLSSPSSTNKEPFYKTLLSKFNYKKNSIKKRHVLTIYAFFGFFFAYSMRANLSVAIVDMAKLKTKTSNVNLGVNSTIISDNLAQNSDKEWSPILQGYILSSFFYGYILTQMPAAFLTTKYGGKIFFGAGVGVCSVLSLLIPLAAYIGPTSLIIIRVLQGISQGFIFPSMHCLWSKWSPPFERSSLATFAFSGSYIGSVVALSGGGIIGEHINWQSIFYVFGGAGAMWSVLWFFFIYESPVEHESIDEDEKIFIVSSLKTNNNNSIPWSSILKSAPVWAIVCAHFTENWGFYTMLTEMPTFLSEVMKYKIDKAGIISSMPYLIMAIILYTSGYISDCLIKRKMSYTYVRKLFCCLGLVLQSLSMILIALSTGPAAIIECVIFAVGFGGMPWASFGVNHLDIGAGYANVLMSISNTFATLPGIISPILTGHLIKEKKKSEWNTVFWISAIIFLFGSLVFGLLASGETQPWACDQSEFDDEKKSKKSESKNNLSRESSLCLNENEVLKKSNDNKNLIERDLKETPTTTTTTGAAASYESISSKVVLSSKKD